MRRAELIGAGVLALLSLYFMYKSAELDIGYIRGSGPGGGAWPFWLSAIMLISTAFIAFNAYRGTSVPSQNTEPLLDAYAKKTLLTVGGGLIAFVALIDIISMYFAMMAFIFYYVRFLGKHSWTLTFILGFGLPIGFFVFFEGLMRVTMPKGMSFLDPFYNVLYGIIY